MPNWNELRRLSNEIDSLSTGHALTYEAFAQRLEEARSFCRDAPAVIESIMRRAPTEWIARHLTPIDVPNEITPKRAVRHAPTPAAKPLVRLDPFRTGRSSGSSRQPLAGRFIGTVGKLAAKAAAKPVAKAAAKPAAKPAAKYPAAKPAAKKPAPKVAHKPSSATLRKSKP